VTRRRFLTAALAAPLLPALPAKESRLNPYRVHYRPPDGYVGDVHPFYHDGVWYLFYLKPPREPQRHGIDGMVSALATSRDLLHWEERTMAHRAPAGDPDAPPGRARELPWYVIGAIRERRSGRFYTFYIRHGGFCASVSDDLIHWEPVSPDPIFPPPPGRYREWRDGNPFWNEAAGRYGMVITSSILGEPEATGGAISYAESDDLVHWEYSGTLYHPGDVGSPECPEVFALGRRWYLVASFFRPGWGVGRTSYRVAESPLGPYAASTPASVDGMDLCAGNSGTDGKRRILWAWVPTYAGPEESRRQEWGGDVCLPRELYPLADGSLGVRLPADVGKAIRGDRLFSADALPAAHPLPVPGGALDLVLTLHLKDGPDGTCFAGVAVRSASGKPDLWIGVDIVRRELTFRRAGDGGPVFSRLPVPASLPAALPLRVVLDGDIGEAFLADRYALACRLPETSAGAALSPVADGPARFTEVIAHGLNA
jgi:hypothetical protein